MGILEDIARMQTPGYISDSQSISPKQHDSRSLLDLSDDEIDARFAAMTSSQAAPEPTGERTFLGTLGDVGVSAAKGVVGAGEAAVGLANIPTLGRAGKFLEETVGYDSEATQDYLSSLYSPAQQAANQQVSEAEGFLSTVGTAIQNPSTIVHSVIESTPAMLGGGLLGRGLIKAGAKIGPWAAGALGEGAIAGGMMAEDVRQQSETGTITVPQAAKSVGAGIGTSIFGVVGNRLAKRLGVGDIDEWLVGGKLGSGVKAGAAKVVKEGAKSSVKNQKGVINRIISGGITEGIFEELPQSMQEQVWMNAATDQPLGEGVGESGALGMLAGGLMGGGFSIFTQPDRVTTIDETGTTGKKKSSGKLDDSIDETKVFTPEELAAIKKEEAAIQAKKAEIQKKKQAQKEADVKPIKEEKQALSEEEAYWLAEEENFRNQIKVRKYQNVLATALKNDYEGTLQRYVNNPELLAELPIEVQEYFWSLTQEDIPTADLVTKLLSQNQRALEELDYTVDRPFEAVANEFAELTSEEQEAVIKREQSALALIKRQQKMREQVPISQQRRTLKDLESDAVLNRFANRIESHLPNFIELQKEPTTEAEIPTLEGPAKDQVVPIDYGEPDPRKFDPFARVTRRLGGKVFPRPRDISPEAVEGYDPNLPIPRIGTNFQHLQPLATQIRQRDEMLRNPLTMSIEAANNGVDEATFRTQLIQDNIADRAALNTFFDQANASVPLTEREALAEDQAVLIENQNQVRQLTSQLETATSAAERTEINRQILPLLDEQKAIKDRLAKIFIKAEPAVTDSEINTDPSEEQKAAGNYKKAKMEINGFKISIENPAGSIRTGTDPDGNEWSSEMAAHYGYFQRSEGKDGDQVDVFVKPGTKTSSRIFVVDQIDPKTGKFDEHKVVFGAKDVSEAADIYLANYEDGWQGLGNITELTQENFKKWLNTGKRNKPVAEDKSVQTEVSRSEGEQQVQQEVTDEDLSAGASIQMINRAITERLAKKFSQLYTAEEADIDSDTYQAIIEYEMTPQELEERFTQAENPVDFANQIKFALSNTLGDLEETYRYEGTEDGKALEDYIDSMLAVVERNEVSTAAMPDQRTESEVTPEEESVSSDQRVDVEQSTIQDRIAANQSQIDSLIAQAKEAPTKEERNSLRQQAMNLMAENEKLGAQFEVREDRTPGQGISLSDVQAIYPGQQVFQSEDGSFSIRFKNGRGVTIQKITDVGDGFIEVAMNTGEMSNKDGKILGVTIDNNILLDKDFADNATLWHENKHVLDNMGLITQEDDAALNREFNRLRKAGKLTFALSTHEDPVQAMRENRANTFAQIMLNRAEYRNKPLGTLIQRVLDFFNKLLNLGRQTVSGLAREVETGRIYERKVGDQTYHVTVPQMEQSASTFYSQLRNTIDQKMSKGTGESVKKQVQAWANKGEFKQDELEWSGLMNWLKGKKTVTKKDVLDYLDANQVRIEEIVKDDNIVLLQSEQDAALRAERDQLLEEYDGARFTSRGDQIANRLAEIEFELDALNSITTDMTKFSEYQEPGGTNYKEILLTLPAQGAKTVEEYYTSGGYANDYPGAIDVPWSELNDYQKRLIAEAHAEAGNQDTRGQDYKGPHYDEPNILVHVRMNDRTGPNGERVLFLEEIQSDWHQEGRKKGYKKNEAELLDQINSLYYQETKLREGRGNAEMLSPADRQAEITRLANHRADFERQLAENVPDAPFKGSKSWAMLAMKQMVRYAAENGYDQIAWTPGEIQAARYDLSKQVDSIAWEKTDINGEEDAVLLKMKKDGVDLDPQLIPTRKLEDYIGKDLAAKIDAEPKAEGIYSGLDLKIGGEGMKGFYDKILPAEVNKFFNKKSWGKARVGQTNLQAAEPRSGGRIASDGKNYWLEIDGNKLGPNFDSAAKAMDYRDAVNKGLISVWSLPITPKMRSKALREGFPQFQVAETNISDPNTPTRDIPQEEYDRIHAHKKNVWDKVRQVSRMTKADAKLFLDKIAGPISTRLKNISPLLSAKLRKLDFDTTTQISQQLQVALPIMRAVDKMSSADRSAWDWATKNGDINRINALAAKYDIKENYNQLRQVLDNIRKAAIDVGYDVGYVDNYWPRILKDTEGFLQATKEISRRPEFTDALKAKAKKLGISVKNMDKDLKADIIGNIILSNYGGIGGPGNIQGRVFDVIPEEFAPYYMDSGAALMQYIYSMNKKIEARRFFGRVPTTIGRAKTKVRTINTRLVSLQEMEALMTSEGQDTTDINNKINELQDEVKLHQAVIEKYKINDRDFSENIDTYIVELMEKGIITEDHETTVKEILNARFHEKGTHGIINKYKNFSYIDTMGSPISALTQIGDLAWAYYVGGLTPAGIVRTTKNLIKAVFNESGITKEDLGIERIAQEFADADTMSNAVSWVFKKVGLEKIDSIGKETLINTAFENYKDKASNNPEALKKEIRHIFGKETNSVVQDLLANNPSENVKLLVYNRLLDFQPVALSEMPEKYLNSGNGRIFYMLKTYTLKQIDVFRREVYQQLKSKDPQVVMSGMRNLIGLASVLTLANAGADALKDLIMGKESKFEDHVIENLLTLGGASRYLQTQIRKDGAGSALFGQILPPFKFVDSLTRDVFGDVSEGVRSVESIPVVGKLYYWHYGRGSEKKLSLAEQEFNKLKKETNKFKNQFDKAGDKREFLRSNIDQFRQMKMVDSMQGSLNRNKALINKLKDMPQTPNIQKRIAQVKRQRDLMLENFFQRTNMGD